MFGTTDPTSGCLCISHSWSTSNITPAKYNMSYAIKSKYMCSFYWCCGKDMREHEGWLCLKLICSTIGWFFFEKRKMKWDLFLQCNHWNSTQRLVISVSQCTDIHCQLFYWFIQPSMIQQRRRILILTFADIHMQTGCASCTYCTEYNTVPLCRRVIEIIHITVQLVRQWAI